MSGWNLVARMRQVSIAGLSETDAATIVAATAALEAAQRLTDARLVVKLNELVGQWGEPRHPSRLGFHGRAVGLTCGDVYELVDSAKAVRDGSR